MSTHYNQHVPVLLDPILDFLKTHPKSKRQKRAFDGTLGGGSYSRELLDHGYEVTASDLDYSAIENLRGLDKFARNGQLKLINGNFADVVYDFDDSSLDIITLDLGFSSNQLESVGRGFSYQKDQEILDLRYNPDTGLSCSEKLKKVRTTQDLWTILYTYSGESLSRPVAKAIFELTRSKNSKHFNVLEIKEAVIKAIPKKFLKNKNAILSRVWQALRIWTNREFESLEKFLKVAHTKLAVDGLLCIVSFHSLEDKIVTKYMRYLAKPVEIDGYGNKRQNFKLLTPKPIAPSEEEIMYNSRSRSATLRVLKRLV
ncbi:MAG: 16S rRNA (cytosine(1402)-N(4))-methyltransferase RsmH [Patescibacteria group bacterium]